MKRNKDEDKDDGIVSGATAAGVANTNNNAKICNNAASNTSGNSNDANIGSGGTAGTVRTTGRVKKPKQVYDPSDNYISRGSRHSLPTPISISTPSPALAAAAVSANATTSTTLAIRAASPAQPANEITPSLASIGNSSNNNSNSSINNDDPMDGIPVQSAEHQRNYDTCKKCGKSEQRRGSGYKSNFLTCKTCSLKWHFNCLPIAFEVLSNARKRYKCDKCRRCRICVNGKSNEQLMMCSLCANAFHLDCHRPRVMRSKLNDSKWKCYDCDPKYNSFDVDSAADGVAIVESQSQPLMQTSSSSSSSPPRKSKAGRKKRAKSDPAAGNAKMMAFGKQMLGNEDEGYNGNSGGSGGAIDRAATKSVIPQLVQATESIKSIDDEETVSLISNPQSPHASNASIIDLNLDSSMSSSSEAKENQDSSAQNVAAAMPDELQLELQRSVRLWSVEQVVDFVKRFYPRESEVFETQEIDGAALMVLTRQDIIDRFGLKLGPALRVFELVLLLQTSTDDVSLAWCH